MTHFAFLCLSPCLFSFQKHSFCFDLILKKPIQKNPNTKYFPTIVMTAFDYLHIQRLLTNTFKRFHQKQKGGLKVGVTTLSFPKILQTQHIHEHMIALQIPMLTCNKLHSLFLFPGYKKIYFTQTIDTPAIVSFFFDITVILATKKNKKQNSILGISGFLFQCLGHSIPNKTLATICFCFLTKNPTPYLQINTDPHTFLAFKI